MADLVGWEQYLQSEAQASLAPSNLGRPPSWRELASQRQDPLMAFDWNVSIRGPNGLEIGNSHVEEIQVPMPKYDADSVTYQGRKYYFAKFEEFGASTIKFYIDNRLSALNIVRQWQQLMKSNKGNYRVPSAYKGTIIVTPCDTKQTPIAQMTMFGVFPTQVPNLNETSAGERVTMDIEFSVDSVETIFYRNPQW